MRLYLLTKQVIKNNQRYLLSFVMVSFVLGLFGYVSQKNYLREMTMVLLIGHSFLYPMMVASQLYHKVNIDHMASFPFKRTQVLAVYQLLGYMLGLLGLFVMSLVGKFPMDHVMPLFIGYSYYYTLFMLCFVICGHNLFYIFTCAIFGTFGFAVWGMMNTLLQSQVAHFDAMLPSAEVLVLLLPGMMMTTTPSATIYHTLMVWIVIFVVLSFLVVRKRRHEDVGNAVTYRPLNHVLVMITAIYVAGGLMTLMTFGFHNGSVDLRCIFHFILVVLISALLVGLIYQRKFKCLFTLKLSLATAIALIVISTFSVYTLEHYTPDRYQNVSLMIDYGKDVLIEEDDKADDTVRKLQRLLMQDPKGETHHTVEFAYGYKPFTIHSIYDLDDARWQEAVSLLASNDLTYQALMQNEYECVQLLSEGKVTYVDIGPQRYNLSPNEIKSIANVLSKQIEDLRYSEDLAQMKADYMDSVAFGGDKNEYYIYGSRLIYDTVKTLLQSKGIIIE